MKKDFSELQSLHYELKQNISHLGPVNNLNSAKDSEIKPSDIEALRREFSDETSAKCLEAVTQLKSQIDQEQTEKLIELEQQLKNLLDEKKRLERSVLKQTESLATVQGKLTDIARKQ